MSKLNINGIQLVLDPLVIKDWISERDSIVMWPSLYYHDISRYLELLAPDFIYRLESEYKLG